MDRSSEEQGTEKGVDSGPVGLFTPSLAHLRKSTFGAYARTLLILMVYLFAAMALYWAALDHTEANLSSLTVLVVDFDGSTRPYASVTPRIGPLVQELAVARNRQSRPHLGYEPRPPSEFNNDPIAVRRAVYDFQAWAAIIVNNNATALLEAAVDSGNASYDPLGAAQIVYLEARDQTTYSSYIIPELNSFASEIAASFGKSWAQSVFANRSIPLENLEQAPQAVSPAIGFSTYNLRPFGPADVTPAVTVGLIYLIIITFANFAFFMPIYMRYMGAGGKPVIPIYQLVMVRWFGNHLSYFFLSLAYSLTPLAFRIPFANPTASPVMVAENPNAYGKGTFVVYWMINFFGMSAFGMANENAALILGQPWTSLWLIFWVITNVSTSFYAIELAPRFFYWGYAWPMRNIVEASRTILFDLHSRLGLNFGVLIVWIVINTILFPFASLIAARRAKDH